MRSSLKLLRKFSVWGAAALLLAATYLGTRSAAQSTTSDDAAFRRVSNRLLCQCGCGYMVLSCNHVDCSSATYIRKTIQTALADGKSEDAIVAGFVEQYGPKILPEPPRQGFSWMAWLMPFAALLLGGGAVSYVLWRWKRGSSAEELAENASEPQAEPASGEVPPAIIEKYRAQIDRDLENE